MQENTNKAIAINSITLYVRMAVTAIMGLFTTRFSLLALGVNDFGLFAVVGSIMTFVSIFNTIMLSTCNRFLAVAIGKGNESEINKVFNVNRIIFWGCALILLFIAFPLGYYYVSHYINYDGPIDNALLVFSLSILGSVISTFSIPYNGLLVAKERFILFCAVDVILHLVRLIVTYLLIYHFSQKLLIYSLLQAFTIATPTLVYSVYCNKVFPVITKFRIIKDKHRYVEIFSFSGWVGFGAVATVARQQGAALLVNAFFNTVMNTALGIANSINMYIMLFANNLTQPIQPQITKSYAVNNMARTKSLLIASTKYSFMLMLLISTPFIVEPEWIIQIWLGEVPEYAAIFTLLFVIDNLIQSFNSGISTVIFASGKIALYQILINSLRILSIVGAYIVLRNGAEPQSLFFSYIIFSAIIIFATQFCLQYKLGFNIKPLIINSYFPCICIIVFFTPIYFVDFGVSPFANICLSIIYLLVLEFIIGTSKSDKSKLLKFVKKRHRFRI